MTWDRHRAEYGDVVQQSRMNQRRACTVCGKPTRALSGICTDHVLTLFDQPPERPTERPPSAQVGVDDPWPENMF